MDLAAFLPPAGQLRRIDVHSHCRTCGAEVHGVVGWYRGRPDPLVTFPHWTDAEGVVRHRMEVTPTDGPRRRG